MNTKLFPLAAAMLLTACGFHLKGSLPYDRLPYKNWHIRGGELQVPLENALRRSDGLPVSAAQAQASVTVDGVEQQKDVLTITRAAMINEYRLALRVRAQVSRNGEPVGEPMQIEGRRTLEYADSEILGKQEEEAMIWQEMRRDAAQQIVRRLPFAVH